MDKKDLEYFKQRLLAEKKEIEEELGGISERDPNTPGGLDPTSGGMEVDAADDNELADKFEELQDNASVVTDLEKQLEDVNIALEKIEKGTYGIDEGTGKPIDRGRLEANPSARTNVKG